jgi:membrane protease YdiL (CAAX protease family)
MASRAAGVVKRHPLITFFVLAYAVAWAFVPFGSFGAFGPMVAALVVVPLTQGRAGLRELGSRLVRWRVRWFWYLVALGLPLAIHLLTAGLHTAAGDDGWSVRAASVSAALLTFLVRLVNPTDGPLGEEPGWRGFALPGLQSRYSPLAATTILALLVAGWHLPLFFLEEGGLQPPVLVGGLVTTVAVTYWYAWLFNHSAGSVLLVLMAHSIEGSLQAQGWIYMGVWCVAGVALIVFDPKAWRRPVDPRVVTSLEAQHRPAAAVASLPDSQRK